MERKPAFSSMLLSPFVLFLLIMVGTMPIAAGAGMSDERPGSQDAVDKTGKSRGTAQLPSSKCKPKLIANNDIVLDGPWMRTKVVPDYPELARRARVSGKVILKLSIDEEGYVTAVDLIRGHPFLNAAAIEKTANWTYAPCLIDGKPVPMIAEVTVIFNLDNKSVAASGKSRIDLAVSGCHDAA
jgi:TonB family protein